MTDWIIGGHKGRFSRDPLPVFSAGSPCEQLWPGQGCPLFDVVHPAFPLLTTALPTLQDAPKDGFGEAVIACDMPKPYKLLLPEEVPADPHRTLHPVVGLVLQVEDTAKFPHALSFESLDPFFRVSKQGPCSTAVDEDGGDKKLQPSTSTCLQQPVVQLVCNTDSVVLPDLFGLVLLPLLTQS